MAKKTVAFEVKADVSKAEKGTEALKDDFKDLNKEAKAFSKETKKGSKEMEKGFQGASKNAKELGSSMGGATGAAVSFATGIKSMTKAAIAFIATPLGLLLAGIAVTIAAVKAAFTDSEEGQNKYAKLMSVISVVVGNLRDLLADFGEKVIAVFENPQQALKDFSNLVKENIVNRFEGLIELIPQLGKAMQQLFKGDFAEAGATATNAVAKLTLGVDDMTGKINAAAKATKDFLDVTIEEANQGAKVADMRAKADKIERKLLVDRSKAEGKIAELRLKARQEDQFSAEERKAAINEAIVLQDGLLKAETEVLQLRADAQTLENTFSRSNKENLDKEAKAIAAVNRQTATRLNTQRQFQRELNTINAQLEAEDKASKTRIAAERKKALEEEEALKRQLRDAEIALIKSEEEREIAEAEEKLARRLEKIQGESEIELELRKNLETIAGQQIQAIRDKFAAEEKEKKAASDAKVLAQEKQIADAKINLALTTGNVLGQVANLINQQSQAGVIAAKTLAVAQVAIDTAVAVSGAIAQAQSVPYPGNLVAIGTGVAAVLGAIAQATTILNSTSVAGPSANIPTSINTPSGAAPSTEPVTTATTQFNEEQVNLANIGPIQTFVVETEMTTTQGDINQIQNQATFG